MRSTNHLAPLYAISSIPPLPRPPLGPNILLNTLFSNTHSFLSSRNVSDQVSHPYKTQPHSVGHKWGSCQRLLSDRTATASSTFRSAGNEQRCHGNRRLLHVRPTQIRWRRSDMDCTANYTQDKEDEERGRGRKVHEMSNVKNGGTTHKSCSRLTFVEFQNAATHLSTSVHRTDMSLRVTRTAGRTFGWSLSCLSCTEFKESFRKPPFQIVKTVQLCVCCTLPTITCDCFPE